MEQDYTPIHCDFYDELESISTLRRKVVVVWLHNDGRKEEVVARISNLYVRKKVEYMLLDNGIEIRLDMLVSVDGNYPASYC